MGSHLSTKKVCPCQTASISILKALWLGMLNKFLKVPKLSRFSGWDTTKPAKRPVIEPHKSEERLSSKVRIVHAGGKVEVHFMAIPAYKIMEKYPSHFVTRPEVFRRPWDSVVKPDDILALGKKYYLVPCRTVKKLRRMILKPNIVSREDTNRATNTHVLESLSDISLDSEDEAHGRSYVHTSDASDTSIGFRAGSRRKIGTKKRVHFKGIEDNQKRNATTDATKPHDQGDGDEDDGHKGIKPEIRHNSRGDKRRPKLPALTWQPSLASITETTHE